MAWNGKKSNKSMSEWTTGVGKKITLEGRKKMFAMMEVRKRKTMERKGSKNA